MLEAWNSALATFCVVPTGTFYLLIPFGIATFCVVRDWWKNKTPT